MNIRGVYHSAPPVTIKTASVSARLRALGRVFSKADAVYYYGVGQKATLAMCGPLSETAYQMVPGLKGMAVPSG